MTFAYEGLVSSSYSSSHHQAFSKRLIAEAVERLGGACKVKELDVSCNSIRDAGVKRFAHAIFNNAPLLKKGKFIMSAIRFSCLSQQTISQLPQQSNRRHWG